MKVPSINIFSGKPQAFSNLSHRFKEKRFRLAMVFNKMEG